MSLACINSLIRLHEVLTWRGMTVVVVCDHVVDGGSGDSHEYHSHRHAVRETCIFYQSNNNTFK